MTRRLGDAAEARSTHLSQGRAVAQSFIHRVHDAAFLFLSSGSLSNRAQCIDAEHGRAEVSFKGSALPITRLLRELRGAPEVGCQLTGFTPQPLLRIPLNDMFAAMAVGGPAEDMLLEAVGLHWLDGQDLRLGLRLELGHDGGAHGGRVRRQGGVGAGGGGERGRALVPQRRV